MQDRKNHRSEASDSLQQELRLFLASWPWAEPESQTHFCLFLAITDQLFNT